MSLEDVRDELVGAFTIQELKEAILYGLRQELAAIVNVDQQLNAVAFELLGWAQRQGPDQLVQLLAILCHRRAGRISLYTASASIVDAAKLDAEIDSFHTRNRNISKKALLQGSRCLFIEPGYPLVDRDDLRDSIEKLVSNPNNVLVVLGPPGCGRSYSWHLVRCLENNWRVKGVDLTDLAHMPGATMELHDWVEAAALRLGLSLERMPAKRLSTDAAVAGLLSEWFIGASSVSSREGLRVVVIDHLDKPEAASISQLFVKALATAVIKGRAKGGLSLVLVGDCDYGYEIYDYVDPTYIDFLQEKDLEAYLQTFLNQLNIKFDDLSPYVKAITGGKAPSDLNAMRALRKNLVQQLKKIISTSATGVTP